MGMLYELFYNNVIAGQVRLEQEGAYYRVYAKFNQISAGLYRLYGYNEKESMDFGLGIPKGDYLEYNTRISIRQLGDGPFSFFIKKGKNKDLFVPILPNNPFLYLNRLESAYLDRNDGVFGIRIKC